MIEAATNTITGVPIPVAGPTALAVSPGRYVYVGGRNGVSVIDTVFGTIEGDPIIVPALQP